MRCACSDEHGQPITRQPGKPNAVDGEQRGMSTTRLIANRFLFAVPVLLVLMASTLAPAAAQPNAPAGITYHHVNWGSSPEARYLQMFRARHVEVPADRDVAVVLYDRDGVTVAAATASTDEDHAVPVD